MNKVSVYRKEHFNAAHRLNNPLWDEAKNNAVFGKCNNPHYHGHNYELIVKLTGVPDSQTGYVMEKFDHRNLNEDCIEFRSLNPTAENIVIVIYNILREKIDKDLDLQVRLY